MCKLCSVKPLMKIEQTHRELFAAGILPPAFVVLSCNDSYRVGAYCNISSAPCDALHPCQNNGTCVDDKTMPTGYQCHCAPGFIGSECLEDTRPCKPTTCFNNGTYLFVTPSVRIIEYLGSRNMREHIQYDFQL